MKSKKIIFYGLVIFLIITLIPGLSGNHKNTGNGIKSDLYDAGTNKDIIVDEPWTGSSSRPFYMGFTPWPPDLTFEAVDQAYSFIDTHGDITAHHFDAGVPWIEALEDREFPDHLKNDWDTRSAKTPEEHAVYVAITPMNFERDDLALYWGESGSQPLPEPWSTYSMNNENVKKAYLNYAKRVIEYFQPEYLAIGIESNILISKSPEKWEEYKELNEYVYIELKKAYPDLLIFSTVQYEHLRGIEDESKKNLKLQRPEVSELMKNSDILALSTYKFGSYHNQVSGSYFDTALSFGKPIAIAETGAISRDVTIFGTKIESEEKAQEDFINFVLQEAAKNDFLFVINFVTIDFDMMIPKLPEGSRELAKVWVYTGLERSDGTPKSALTVWDSYKNLHHEI